MKAFIEKIGGTKSLVLMAVIVMALIVFGMTVGSVVNTAHNTAYHGHDH